jgi:hypothetical protein
MTRTGIPVQARTPLSAAAHSRYLQELPIGVMIDSGQVNFDALAVNMIGHPVTGLLANNLPYVLMTNTRPWFTDGGNGAAHVARTLSDRGIRMVVAPFGQSGSASDSGLDGSWYQGNDDFSEAAADLRAAALVPYYDDIPGVLAYGLGDDVDPHNGAGMVPEHVAPIANAMERADSCGRPSTAVYTGGDPLPGRDRVRLVLTYAYPYTLLNTAEGDSHGGGFSLDSSVDFAEQVRARIAPWVAAGARVWWIAQAHKTNGSGQATLRYPTYNETIKQLWIVLGEGCKGAFAFSWTDQAGVWEGLGNASGRARLTAWAAFSSRLHGPLRALLLSTTRDDARQIFTASGGGYTNPDNAAHSYANAYCSTLYDPSWDRYYLVLCNQDPTQSRSVTVTGTVDGVLRNLELPTMNPTLGGTTFQTGESVTLPPMDGSIWMLEA